MVISASTKRILLAGAAGLAVSVAIVYLMSWLIKSGDGFKPSSSTGAVIDFIKVRPASDLETRKREIPKKPPPPKVPPKVQKMAVQSQQDLTAPRPDLSSQLPNLDLPFGMGSGPVLGNMGAQENEQGDASAMPLVRIEPQYPRDAALAGVSGSVLLQFDINETGAVDNIKVLEVKPTSYRTFGQNATRALMRWKYKPKLVDGKAVRQVGLTVLLEFKLDEEAG